MILGAHGPVRNDPLTASIQEMPSEPEPFRSTILVNFERVTRLS